MDESDEITKSEELSPEDIAFSSKLIKEVPSLVSNVLETIDHILTRVKNNELETTKGLSFLDLKNQTLLQYLMNLTLVISQKLSGQKIENDPAIDRLVELRIVLEKMKPIDEKLKYQINKLLTAATTGSIDESDPLRFKANPENLEDQDDSEEEADHKTESNIYVPPKISAAYFDEDTLESRKKKILERSQKKALSSTMLYELRKEYDTGPEEIKETVDPYKHKFSKEMKERERYEEEFMMRLPMTKKQKHDSRQLTTVSNFNLKFDDISALDLETEGVSLKSGSSKKRKFSKKYQKKKGKKRKR